MKNALILLFVAFGLASEVTLANCEEAWVRLVLHSSERVGPPLFEYHGATEKKVVPDAEKLLELARTDPEAFRREISLIAEHNETLARKVEDGLRHPLTHLFNRSAFEEMIFQIFTHADAHGLPVTFLSLDANKFKQINDRLSHLRGDEHLIDLAEVFMFTLFKAHTRKGDFIFHIGGDEFLIVLQNTNQAGGKIVADRLSQAVNNSTAILKLAQDFLAAVGPSHPLRQENAAALEDALGPQWKAIIEAGYVGTVTVGVAERGAMQTPTETKTQADLDLETQKGKRNLDLIASDPARDNR